MVDKVSPKEQSQFTGSVRLLKEDDLVQLKKILEFWLKDRDTGESLPAEVSEVLAAMEQSFKGASDRNYFVAEENGKAIGMVGYKLPDESMRSFARTSNPAELINAYVDASERGGRGVGRALVAKLEEVTKAIGFTEIILNSGPRYLQTGWGFYDKLPGYKRINVAKNLYGEGGDAPIWSKVFLDKVELPPALIEMVQSGENLSVDEWVELTKDWHITFALLAHRFANYPPDQELVKEMLATGVNFDVIPNNVLLVLPLLSVEAKGRLKQALAQNELFKAMGAGDNENNV